MTSLGRFHTTLATRVLIRLGLTALVIVTANVIYAMAHNAYDRNHFFENIVRTETRTIAELYSADFQTATDRVIERFPHFTELAGFRLVDGRKTVVAARNGALVARVGNGLSYDPNRSLLQVSAVTSGSEEFIWGVMRHTIGERDLLVEVALPAALANVIRRAYWDELSLHVWIPLIPSVLIFLVLAHRSVHSGLAPLSTAISALQRAEVSGGRPPALSADRLTSEVGQFVFEVDAAFRRHSALLRFQQEFVGRVAHELRTPLTVMTLDLAAIEDARARIVEQDVGELSEKITKMLAWARMDLATLAHEEDIDLARLARGVVVGLRRLSDERRVTVELHCEEGAFAAGDRISLKEAIRNMVENAVKHTPIGSRVVVTCGPGAQVSVTDNGAGFPDVDDVLLLQPFWKGNTAADGAGLGLSLVKRVADSHGARLLLGRSRDGGARISLRFPSSATASGPA